MRLYPKRLRSIDDLEKERKHLIQKSKRLEKEEFMSLEGLLGSKPGKASKDKTEKKASLVDMLPISNPLVSMALKMIERRFAKREPKPKIVYAPPPPGTEKKGASKLKAIAIEFVGGYLKWKAIELTYKGIRHLVRRNRAGE